jgi:peptidase E
VPVAERNIVALGGGGFPVLGAGSPIDRFTLELTGAAEPRVLFLATATGDNDFYITRFYDAFRRVRPSHVKLFGIPPPNLAELVLGQDAIYVGGGNTANMLAVWRLHGLDRLLREAWEAGTVLTGVSAGSICWFDAGVTDSFRAELDGIDCLGFLAGSNCPHYDGEETRRPAYHRLVREGFPAGVAADDGCALHFRGAELVEAVAEQRGAQAYRVEVRAGEAVETPLGARRLG